MHRLAIHQGRQLGQQSLAAIQIRIHGTQLRLQARGLEEHQRYLHHRGHGTACIVQRILRFPQPLGERIRVARLALGVVQQDVRGQVPGCRGHEEIRWRDAQIANGHRGREIQTGHQPGTGDGQQAADAEQD